MAVTAASLILFPTPPHPPTCISSSLPPQTLFSRPYPLSPPPLPILSAHKPVRGFSSVSASTPRRRSQLLIAAVATVDSGEAGDEWDALDKEEDEEEEEEGELMPLEEMSLWLRNKPAGFGEGKTYDTSMEEKLMEEIERAQEAQVANINKLRNGPSKQQKDAVVVPNGIRVRVCNLPRKKNIHRDLQLAFKEFHGIINIEPAVIGNKKTRDPVCKGFAFIDLSSEEAADRFVQKYSKQHVLFGKVEKLITCNVINPRDASHNPEQLADCAETFTPKYTEPEDEMAENSGTDQTEEETILNLNGREGLSSCFEETGTSAIEQLNAAHLHDAEQCSQINEDHSGSNGSLSALQKQGTKKVSKKMKVKSKSVKNSTVNLPPSMVRLKVKERTALTGALSKYGGKVASDLSK